MRLISITSKKRVKILVVSVTFLLLLAKPGDLSADSERGKKLFKEKHCALCHNIELPGTEFKPICPGLRGVKNRHGRGWLAKWLANPGKVWKTGDTNVRDINRRYFAYRGIKSRPRESFMATVIGKTIYLSPTEIKDLIDYLLTL